jgi:RimJ/RimL family protein N-acetyltransferase
MNLDACRVSEPKNPSRLPTSLFNLCFFTTMTTSAMPTWGPVSIELEGRHVRLVPLSAAHLSDLVEAASDPEIWLYLQGPFPKTARDMQVILDKAAIDVAARVCVAFAIIDTRTGRAIGSTRYIDIRPHDRAVEIGWTWLARSAWRTPINTECKYLLLRHAFDDLDALRVQLKTDNRNERSKAAIARIGAKAEGVHRCERVLWDGYVRDTAYFSVVHYEWPAVRAELERKLSR